jgi:hypothetical protein
MRNTALTATKAGIQRLREKGGANAESLFDLVNGYVTAQRTTKHRPGTDHEYTLPSGTKGLMTFGAKLVVFAIEPVEVGNDLFEVEVIVHPTEPGMALLDILFAEPFLGYPYVVAEFADGSTHHYWLQRRDAWEADTIYAPGDVVEPTSRNGFAYRARPIDAEGVMLWAPNVARAEGDEVVPTAGGTFIHEVIAVAGASPRSGATEPTWATEEGGVTIEDADAPATVTPPAVPPIIPPGTNLPPIVDDRYDRPPPEIQ